MKKTGIRISGAVIAGLAMSLSIQYLAANVDMSTQQQGIPLQGVHPQQYAHPAERGLFISPGAAAEARRHQEAAAQQLRDIEWGARDHRIESDLHEFSKVIELPVENRQGIHLGIVEDLLVDLETDRLEFVIVSTDREGEYRVVPPRVFEFTTQEDALVLDISERRWQQAPSIDLNQLARLDEDRHSREIYRYYETDFRARTWGARRQATERAPGPRNRPGRPHASAWGPDQRADPQPDERAGSPQLAADGRAQSESVDRAHPPEQPRIFGMRARSPEARSQRPSLNNPRMHASVRGSGPGMGGAMTGLSPDEDYAAGTALAAEDGDRQQRVWGARTEERLQQASHLIGREVRGEGEQSAGEISDLLVDIHRNRLEYIIIDSAEAAGQRFAVPVQEVHAERGDRLALNRSLPALEEAPDFERGLAMREPRIYHYTDAEAREWAAPEERDEPELDEPLQRQDEEIEFGAPEHRDPDERQEFWEDEIRSEESEELWDREGPRGQERGQDEAVRDQRPY